MQYTLSQTAKICSGELHGADIPYSGVSIDSRSFDINEEAMFIALRGANHDGHSYIQSLYARGVRAFMVESIPAGEFLGAGFVRVENTLAALQQLAAHHRQQFQGVVVAVTGSNGKTVVKEWIAQSAPMLMKIFRSPKSYNSQVGVALSLLMIEGDEQVAVIEAGISKTGEMERLEAMIRPDIGMITTIGDAHQENFVSVAQKLDEKLSLFLRSRAVVYNSTYQQIKSALHHFPKSVKLVDASKFAAGGKFRGTVSQENAQSVVALWETLGEAAQLDALQPVAMRLELKEGLNGSMLVNDSYTSDINSLGIALDYLCSVASGRDKTLIISDILQSGMSDSELYKRVAELAHRAGVDTIIGIGERISAHANQFNCQTEFYASTERAIQGIKREYIADRGVLIKGNRFSQFEKLSHHLERRSHTTVLEVNLDAMAHNLNYFRSKLKPETRLMAMVKASGYGTGNYEVASMLQHHGVDYLAVAFADEGVLLREQGISMPIVVLNADADSFDLMIANRLEPEIYNFTSLHNFTSAVKSHGEQHYPVHIKIDSGMHRLGFEERDMKELCVSLSQDSSYIRVATIFSHLATSDDTSKDDFTRQQIETFDRLSNMLTTTLPYNVIRHTANSAAIERFPEAQYDMCRLGIGLYGVGYNTNPNLQLVSTLKTRIVQIKHLNSDQTVGYGQAGKLSHPTVMATLPIGYADGMDRHLGCGAWSMLVNGKSAPIVGRVCMDSCMIDITGIDGVREGDEAVIFSPQVGNTVEDMAKVLDTIPYEVMTSISTRVKRIYIKE